MDLECVGSFLVLVEEEHFGRAAARLHLSSPALTKRIQRLERQVGVALIEHRMPGGFALTAAGRRFLRHARDLMLHAEITWNSARELPVAPLRLGVPGRLGDSPSRDSLHRLVTLLHQRNPEYRLTCHAIPYSLTAEALLQQRIDVAWTTSGFDHPEVESVPLTMMWRVGVVPRGHEFADAVAVDAADFAEEPILYNPAIPAGMTALGSLGDYRPLSEARLVPVRADRIADVLQGVAQGLGVAAMPAALLPAIADAGLRALSLVGLMPVEIHALRRRADTREAVFDLVRLLGLIASQRPRERSPAVYDHRGGVFAG